MYKMSVRVKTDKFTIEFKSEISCIKNIQDEIKAKLRSINYYGVYKIEKMKIKRVKNEENK